MFVVIVSQTCIYDALCKKALYTLLALTSLTDVLFSYGCLHASGRGNEIIVRRKRARCQS